MISVVSQENAAKLAGLIEPQLQSEFNRPDLHIAYAAIAETNTFYFRIQGTADQTPPSAVVAEAARAKLVLLTQAKLDIKCLGRVVAL